MIIYKDVPYVVSKKDRLSFWDDISNQYGGSTRHWSLQNFLGCENKQYILQLEPLTQTFTLRRTYGYTEFVVEYNGNISTEWI